jgi:hypothetical protein
MIKKPIVTFSDAWPWSLILALVGGATVEAILYAKLHNSFDEKGFFVLGLTVTAFVLLTAIRFTLRGIAIEKWNDAFQTRLGTAVIPNDVVDVPFRKVDQVCDDAAFYWKDWAIKNKGLTANSAQSLIATAFSGATISCSSTIIDAGNPLWSGKFLGLEDGQNISVVYDKKVIIADTAFLQLVKHETSHLCLTGLGIAPGFGGINHHEIFAQTGYC